MELTKQIGVLRNRKTLDGRKADRNKVNLEYWNFNENLGDLLAPVVTQWMLHRLGLDLYREAAKPCHLMTIGSVLGLGVFDAVIWGSGVNSFAHVGRVTTQKGYRKLDIRAVRGPVTAQVLRENGYTCPQIYGDPAILLPLIYPGRRPEKKKKYVVIDHYMKRKTTGDDRLSIRTGDYRTFLDKILEAEVVYSSSLHGIILAESYGVPSVFLRQGMEEESILLAITATVTKFDGMDYRSIASVPSEEDKKLRRVEEGARIPETTVRTQENLVHLHKRGRMLVASYEAIRFQRLDLFSVTLRQIGAYIGRMHLEDAIEVLRNGDGNQNAAQQYTIGTKPITGTKGTLTYDALLEFWSQFDPYTMNTMLVGSDVMLAMLKLDEFQNPLTGLNFQGTGRLSTPLGASLLRTSAMPAGTIIGLDRRFALEMVQGSDVLVEYDKLIDRQLERAAITTISGFAKLFQGAARVLEL